MQPKQVGCVHAKLEPSSYQPFHLFADQLVHLILLLQGRIVSAQQRQVRLLLSTTQQPVVLHHARAFQVLFIQLQRN